MRKKLRLDTLLVNKKIFDSKSRAQAAILAGDVKVNGSTITKSSQMFDDIESLEIEVKTLPFVSRGGFKLEKAIKSFGINLKDVVCIDCGASTGGFTDCMLKNGAKFVYSVDVGYGQLAWKLRNDKKVKVIERTNIKNCKKSSIYDENNTLPSFAAMDLSFISITKVLKNVINLMNSEKPFEIVALIKPQFEAGKQLVGKNGVVRDKNVHILVIQNVINFAFDLNLAVLDLDFSPIKGPKGNIEYLVYLSSCKNDYSFSVENISQKIESVVSFANKDL